MEKRECIYEGKSKQVYATDDPNLVIIRYKDNITAFNNLKKGVIERKGIINNSIAVKLFELLESYGVKTHFHKCLNEREQLCDRVQIIPLEVIVRNLIAGSMAKRLNIPEGTRPENIIFELSYKNDALGDPLINDHHAVALRVVNYAELDQIYMITRKINQILQAFYVDHGLILVDFKIEFGKNMSGEIVLADEISPDTCRLWDSQSQEKLDRDLFSYDLGDVEKAYSGVLQRLSN